MGRKGIAVRAGRWSAQHRKRAILLWFAFVIASLAVGSAIGTKQLGNNQGGTGSSGRADAAVAKLFPQPDQEDVIVQPRGRGETAHSPAVKSAVANVVSRLNRLSVVNGVQSPYAPGDGGQISHDGRSALVQFNLPETRTR